MGCLVAIHQPNFFPWLGYFDKIRRADVFVLLDAVDYPRSGSGGMGSWSNRVRIAIQGEARWATCPVHRLPLGAPLNAAEIDDGRPWRRKMIATLQASYGKAPRFREAMGLLQPLVEQHETNLAAFNIAAIKAITEHLGLATRFERQSELPHAGKATELLISLVKAVGGDAYLAGGGATGYQQDELFEQHGVRLVSQGFAPQPYGPHEAFIPGLSVIDYLMWDGRPATGSPGGSYD
ncbi:WbqC family protein [Bradyrhizobium sp. 26S5]|uniref:WbqC family protein n=1 Tax=unclassified Bradyrhizobium TaxID=2631580 RepID=UPI00140BC315|nr:WbqC family protein [Bradyrhizobium sp. 2S1]